MANPHDHSDQTAAAVDNTSQADIINNLQDSQTARGQRCTNMEIPANVTFKSEYKRENCTSFVTKELGITMGGNYLTTDDKAEVLKKPFATRDVIAKLEENLYLTFLLYLGNPDKYKEQLAKFDREMKDLAKKLGLPENVFGLPNWASTTSVKVNCPIAAALTKPGQQTIQGHVDGLCTFQKFAKEKVPVCDFNSANYSKGLEQMWDQRIDELCKSHLNLTRPTVAEAMRTASYFAYLVAKNSTTKPSSTQSTTTTSSYFPAMSVKKLQELVSVVEVLARGLLGGDAKNQSSVNISINGWLS